MARHSNQDFIRGDLGTQTRMLWSVGLGAIAAVVVIVLVCLWALPKAQAPSGTKITVAVTTLGPGIREGSKVLLSGNEVGEVTSVETSGNGGVDIDLVLQGESRSLLTDAFTVDFRPENYFGTTAVNLIAGKGGTRLVDGRTYQRADAADFSMSTMLQNGSLVVDGTLTKSMIDSLDKVMRYANGLSPLIRTVIILADRVSQTQQHLPSELLAKANGLMEEFPEFNQNLMTGLYSIFGSVYNRQPDGSLGLNRELSDKTNKGLEVAGSDLFGKAGTLLKSHAEELPPITMVLKQLSDPIPGIIGGPSTMDKLILAVDRMQSAFAGPADQRTLKVRLALDMVPAVNQYLAGSGVVPANPAKPGTPGKPADPASPATPAKPSGPAKPSTPASSAKPSTPANPTAPQQGGDR